MNQDDMDLIASNYGFKVGHWPGTYLRLPLFVKQRSASFWNPIIEKIENDHQKSKLLE